jgi:hypothetical protein
MRFVKAEDGPRESVIYTREDGEQFVASSGNRNWRNNNPGNLKPGSVSRVATKDNRKIKDFSPSQFEKLWKAIEDMEGRHKPIINELTSKKKIGKVRKNKKGTIIAYFVDGMGWISKAQGIKLARQGKIDAVVATSRGGNLFLRTRPGTPVEIQLDHLG